MQLQLFSLLAGIFTIVCGLLVLVGWVFDLTVLKSILPIWVSMKANTAFCFVLLGIAMVLSSKRIVVSQPIATFSLFTVARLCALIAGIISLLTLSQYIFGWNLGIDQWLIP